MKISELNFSALSHEIFRFVFVRDLVDKILRVQEILRMLENRSDKF